MPRPIIIDTDPGIDDAVAILLALAAPELGVQGLVAVAGNVKLTAAARNARAVLELGGRPDIPVFAGCPRPIGGARIDAAHVHGDSGLGGLQLPEPAAPLRPEHGVPWLIETLRAAAAGGVTLCMLGPLTNLATALVMAPDITGGIAELVIMGGGTHGNITPAAEFNIYCDPPAAAIVFASGVPITLLPLDVTNLTPSTPGRVEAIGKAGTRCAAAVAQLLTPPGGWPHPGRPPVVIHDACVIAYLLEPTLFGAVDAHVAIETQSPLTLGMTIFDTRGRVGPTNARLVNVIDSDGLYRLLAERLASLP
jgi:purine nucleosidase